MAIESIIPNEPVLKATIDYLKLPENRKETVTNLMIFTVDFLTRNQTHSIRRESDGMTLNADDLMNVDNAFTALILRASIIVDIPQDEIKSIYHDFMFEYTIAMRDVPKKDSFDKGGIDWEVIYIGAYAGEIIKKFTI
jgi:hypothetical protein